MTKSNIPTQTVPKDFTAKLLSNRRITANLETGEELRELHLEIDADTFPCEVGQCVSISIPLLPESVETEHRRMYSIADLPERKGAEKPKIILFVHRCVSRDPVTGQETRGLASNYLCDLEEGATLPISGPHGTPFPIPSAHDATLILIGIGTGIAPFRALVNHLYHDVPEWKGLIRMFYGTRNGIDILYGNDPHADVMQYFDQETFKAFKALSPPPNWADPISWDLAFSERGEELLSYLDKPNTYVYVAGLESIRDRLDTLFSSLLGSEAQWKRIKDDLIASRNWIELLY